MDKIPCEPPLLYAEQSHPDLSAFPWITSAPVLWPLMWPFAGFGLVCWCQFLPSPIPTGELHNEHGTPQVSNLMRFSLTNFFSMSRYLWMAALWSHESTCPASLSSANFLRVHSVLSSRSLMEVLDSTDASADLWGYSISDWPPLGFHALVTAVWAKQFSQVSTYITAILPSPSSVCLYSVRNHAKVKKQNPLLFLHLPS